MSFSQRFDRNKGSFFLRVYERRNKFRYLIKKCIHGKNDVVRDLSSCVIEKFNGYEISQHQLKREQKCFLEPIDIIYESVKDNDKIACFLQIVLDSVIFVTAFLLEKKHLKSTLKYVVTLKE